MVLGWVISVNNEITAGVSNEEWKLAGEARGQKPQRSRRFTETQGRNNF